MRVLILGANGFLGSRLTARLARDGRLGQWAIDELIAFDLRPPSAPFVGSCKVSHIHGDVRDREILDSLFARGFDAIFHLAATLTVDAESDFRRGLETNVLAFVDLLERCRLRALTSTLCFASSIATFGGQLPSVVGDDVFQSPSTSYGTHKTIAELLLADYSRHGFVDGRALRLPIVLTHPGPASGSISDQVAALIREPLRGQATACRMAPDSRLVVASADKVIDGFLRLATLPSAAVHGARTMNLPGLSVTPAEIVQAVYQRLPTGARELVTWHTDPEVQGIIDSWPQGFTSKRALALGFTSDETPDALITSFLSDEASQA